MLETTFFSTLFFTFKAISVSLKLIFLIFSFLKEKKEALVLL